MNAETWVFDLDNTLYPASCGLFAQVDWNMSRFISRTLDIPLTDARRMQKELFREHGTTMRGLMTAHDVDPREFMDAAHDIDLTPINPAPRLSEALGRLPGRKVIYTNGDVRHAENVCGRLGVTRHFEGVFDIVASGYVPKPAPEIYPRMLAAHGVDPATAVMVEDMAKNLKPAYDLGMTTVWVTADGDRARDQPDGGHIHHVVRDVAEWLAELTAPG